MKPRLRHLLCIVSLLAVVGMFVEFGSSAPQLLSPLWLVIPVAVTTLLLVSLVEMVRVDVFKWRDWKYVTLVVWCTAAVLFVVVGGATSVFVWQRMRG